MYLSSVEPSLWTVFPSLFHSILFPAFFHPIVCGWSVTRVARIRFRIRFVIVCRQTCRLKFFFSPVILLSLLLEVLPREPKNLFYKTKTGFCSFLLGFFFRPTSVTLAFNLFVSQFLYSNRQERVHRWCVVLAIWQ